MNHQIPITVLGSSGWIGSALVVELRRQGFSVLPVNRLLLSDWIQSADHQGLVIYAIGLTSDFRSRPFDTVEAHVGVLNKVMQRPGISRMIFLSSTRIYSRSTCTAESDAVSSLSTDPSDLYNLSKLLGESLILQNSSVDFKVVRLSNVVGPGQPVTTFLGSLIEDARVRQDVVIRQSPDIAKDYIALADVVRLLPEIALMGKHRLYNLGSGRLTSHAEIASWLVSQGVNASFASGSHAGLRFPSLDIRRLLTEFSPPADPFRQNWEELLSLI